MEAPATLDETAVKELLDELGVEVESVVRDGSAVL